MAKAFEFQQYFKLTNGQKLGILAQSFCYVNYGSSIFTSKVSEIISVMETQTQFSVVFKMKCELKCQNELFLKSHLSGITSIYVFITEII